jgi:hypothetical protein
MNKQLRVLLAFCVFAAANAAATVRYVDLNSASPSPPYTNWATAATNIQDAVDVATGGDEVVVTNGLYATGGRVVHGTMTNRVVIDKALTVRSVNGPQATLIEGRAAGIATNGDGAIRCVYLGTNAVLSGFTLTNGHTRTAGEYAEQCGGGVWCSGVLTNCTLTGNSALYEGGGAYGGTLNNCVLTGNSAIGQYSSANGGGATRSTLNSCILSGNWADVGGGATFCTLNWCILTGNSAQIGGGTCYGTINDSTFTSNSVSGSSSRGGGAAGYGALNRCILIGNSAEHAGGAADQCTLDNCRLTSNTADYGGGASLSTLNNCIVSTNFAWYDGGGADNCTLNNCTLTRNGARFYGGGTYQGTLNNCELKFNSATGDGGGACYGTLINCTVSGNFLSQSSLGTAGVYGATLTNCIVYANSAPGERPNHYLSTFNYSCSTPLPPGPGNTANNPAFVKIFGWSNLRLQSNSPCINTGNSAYAVSNADLDSRPRIVGGAVDMGAYEFQPGASGEFIGWLSGYGLPTDGSADDADSDSDLLNNWQEWIAGTIPTDAASALRLFNPTADSSGVIVSWQSVSNRTYFLERATNLGATSPFLLLTSNLLGQTGTTSYTDTNAVAPGPFFYRVGVQH